MVTRRDEAIVGSQQSTLSLDSDRRPDTRNRIEADERITAPFQKRYDESRQFTGAVASLIDWSSEQSCLKTIPRPIRSICAKHSAAQSWADRP